MSGALALQHFVNPSCGLGSLPSLVWWLKCFPINFTPCIILHMKKYLNSGVQNVFDMVWELRFIAL
jgi:hypothetical protein